MVSSAVFQTRARTIDHLGREQIADCPTAISELWKNAFDAYARNVSLHIFDGEIPVATLVDDGHGMSLQDIRQKWLTVGTESKATISETPIEDRGGIQQERVKQGQKGIGRLSCAALGKLMLLVSKKTNSEFSACLLDWRLFENPFVMLQDIKLPLVEFQTRNELISQLPDMFDALMGNIWGDGEDEGRDQRIESAWQLFHEQELSEEKDSTKQAIENTVINACFTERHFDTWGVWNGHSSQGTAMFIADIHDDLKSHISIDSSSDAEGADIRAKERFNQTLASFVNPFLREDEPSVTDFKTSVVAWNGSLQRIIIDSLHDFNIDKFDQLEHIIEGDIDEMGQFRGRVKAFGDWHENITISPKSRYKFRKDTHFGAFQIRLGTYEVILKSSSLSESQHAMFEDNKSVFGGCMVYRDHLRVMPYGREDNDFFEIEKRRSKNAGMYVFTNRACFGGVYISKKNNQNLKDKAGREGIIDNKASKLFREVVENILIEVAKRFIGRSSDIRFEKIAENKARHEAEKALADKKKLLKKELKRVKLSIIKDMPLLLESKNELIDITNKFKNSEVNLNQDELVSLKHKINEIDGNVKSYSLSPVPRTLGSVEQDYRDYRKVETDSIELIKDINATINNALDKLIIKEDIDIAEKDFQSKAGILHAKIRKLSAEGRDLLKKQSAKFEEKINLANKEYHQKISVYLDDLAAKRTTLEKVLVIIDEEYQEHELRINQQLSPYISALEGLDEQIDLGGLALQTVNESTKLKKQVEQVNALAQLGISIEIIGHEIEGFDLTMERGLKALGESTLDNHQTNDLSKVVQAHQSLSDSWRFLSPLKLSGEKVRVMLTGDDIYSYVNSFFKSRLEKADIKFSQTDSFKNLSIYEMPSRIYPVFINLVNNSRYWVKDTEESEKLITLDVKDNLVYVSDNGPGVHPEDVDELFSISFPRNNEEVVVLASIFVAKI
ncbi:ATP-binding protein [Veronia pacifica]|uniref:ATP-binding protein n=1 Tax=Veronia pacifica TaxID=1080227 RepID=UPI000AC0C3ED|nr:ATP-binding protein [Veronia pacifica]